MSKHGRQDHSNMIVFFCNFQASQQTCYSQARECTNKEETAEQLLFKVLPQETDQK